jgi:hypothetical protein
MSERKPNDFAVCLPHFSRVRRAVDVHRGSDVRVPQPSDLHGRSKHPIGCKRFDLTPIDPQYLVSWLPTIHEL